MAGPLNRLPETRTGLFRLTPIAGPVNRTCHAVAAATAASTTVTIDYR
jgi:hypothetical protein